MWYIAQHKRSWWKKHSLDILMVGGMMAVFGVPILILFT